MPVAEPGARSPGAKPCTELETRGGIWRYDANKTGQKFSPAERYATGIRNAEGSPSIRRPADVRDPAWTRPAALELACLVRAGAGGDAARGRTAAAQQGGDYGWPSATTTRANKLVLAPEYGGDGKKVGVCAQKIAPVAAFPAHWAPNGMVFYDKQQFPARYRNGVFIAFHGSWNRAPFPHGLQRGLSSAGRRTGVRQVRDFADGFAGAKDLPTRRPIVPRASRWAPTERCTSPTTCADESIASSTAAVSRAAMPGRTVPCPSASAAAGAISVAETKPPEGTNPSGAPDAATLPVAEGATRDMVVLGERIYRGQVGGATCSGLPWLGGHGHPWAEPHRQPMVLERRQLYGNRRDHPGGSHDPKNYRAAMPPMGGAQLTADQVSAVAAYVWALGQAAAGAPAGSAAVPAEIAIPGEKIYPESITAAPDGRLFIGSIAARQIFTVKAGGAAAVPWVGADSEPSLGVYGVFADAGSNTLWACFSSFPGSDKTAQAPSALASYDLQTGKSKARYLLPTRGAFCNDIAVASDGTAYVTDTDNMAIDRLKQGDSRLTVWAGNGSFGPKGGVLDGISVVAGRVIVNTLETSKVFAVPINSDGSAGSISQLVLSRPILEPDGMRKFGEDGVLIIESGGQGRLSRLVIKGNSATVTTLKEGYPDGPVSVAVVATTGYVLEGQLGALFGPARPAQPSKPFHATAVQVGKP